MNQPPTLRRKAGRPTADGAWRHAFVAVPVLTLFQAVSVSANPEGMTVIRGAATATATGPNLTVQASNGAFLNWASFNIAAGEKATFVQPSAGSVVWNQVNDPNPSQLFGRLEANGIVVLANSSGFYFGPEAFVKAAGLVVTTASIAAVDFASASPWSIRYELPSASIVNCGMIQVADGARAFLIAERIDQRGEIQAPGGQIGLVAGREVLLSERPDGRGLSAKVRIPAGAVNQEGRLVADAGVVSLAAEVINLRGLVQADTVRERNGIVELVASSEVNLESGSALHAGGGAGSPSRGGSVTAEAGERLRAESGAVVDVSGGRSGGEGGIVHLSAPSMPELDATVVGRAHKGYSGGSVVLDPKDIILSSSGAGSAGQGEVLAGTPPDTLRLDIGRAFIGFSSILLQATRDITLDRVWDLPASTGVDASGCQLTLDAGRDVRVKSTGGVRAGNDWSIAMTAGKDFTSGGVLPGIGSVALEGGAVIESGRGSIGVHAGKDVSVGTGAIRTVGGGSIHVEAGGNINAGTGAGGFGFTDEAPGYFVQLDGLGGISTGAGGDVFLRAGGDVKAFLPTLAGDASDGGSGAFGAEPGEVRIEAGGNVFGHYVLRNGTGLIQAGADAGRANQLLALSLVKGGWSVNANHIALQEVRNPNGIFNNVTANGGASRHLFDYDEAASVSLRAANAIQLLGLALPRNRGNAEALPVIYAPRLTLEAGAGGITLGSAVTLFPSPTGDLRLTTTQGGDLRTTREGQTYALVMSDSGRRTYSRPSDFGVSDHADVPVQLSDTDPVRFDISGSVRDLLISVPRAARVSVGRDLINTSFLGQNLNASDITEIAVAGRIFNRNDYTFLTLDAAPDLQALLNAVDPPSPASTIDSLVGRFVYNEATHRLGLQRRLTDHDRDTLLSLQVKDLYPNGSPVLDELGNFVTHPGTFLAESVVAQLMALSQDVPDIAPEGYQVGGPGVFRVSAASMDLGITKGVVSGGPRANPALARISPHGADIEVDVKGDLSMFSSAIRGAAGGDITVNSGGTIRVGDPDIIANSDVARGIYSVLGGKVTVNARNDILIAGSRIATYDGGDVVVRSEEGSLDAGVGAQGYVRVERVTVDATDASPVVTVRAIPGSGVLAVTYPGSQLPVGDIRVETPRGDIRANDGGIVQVVLNGRDRPDARITLRAGTLARDSEGKPILGSDGKAVALYPGDIDAGNSGIIGANVSLEASRNIKGVIIARDNIDVSALQRVDVTALASGSVNLAGGQVSGTVVGLGGISVAGADVSANLIGSSVSGASSGQVGFSAASVAAATPQRTSGDEEIKQSTKPAAADDEETRRRTAARPVLTRTVGRVTVILPGK